MIFVFSVTHGIRISGLQKTVYCLQFFAGNCTSWPRVNVLLLHQRQRICGGFIWMARLTIVFCCCSNWLTVVENDLKYYIPSNAMYSDRARSVSSKEVLISIMRGMTPQEGFNPRHSQDDCSHCKVMLSVCLRTRVIYSCCLTAVQPSTTLAQDSVKNLTFLW